MLKSVTLASAAALSLMVAATAPSQAAPTTTSELAQSLAQDSNVQTVQYGYCRRWYRECRYRWGWGWRFRRCMARHGC